MISNHASELSRSLLDFLCASFFDKRETCRKSISAPSTKFLSMRKRQLKIPG